jgi:DNA-binding MarR family transcriptional regulator
MYDEALRPLELRATQLTLLNAVALAGEDQGVTMARLASLLAMDATTLSRNLRPLLARRWVRLTSAPSDARARLVRITPAGARMIAEALPLWTAAHERIVSTLGPDAAGRLKALFDAASEATGSPAPVIADP